MMPIMKDILMLPESMPGVTPATQSKALHEPVLASGMSALPSPIRRSARKDPAGQTHWPGLNRPRLKPPRHLAWKQAMPEEVENLDWRFML